MANQKREADKMTVKKKKIAKRVKVPTAVCSLCCGKKSKAKKNCCAPAMSAKEKGTVSD